MPLPMLKRRQLAASIVLLCAPLSAASTPPRQGLVLGEVTVPAHSGMQVRSFQNIVQESLSRLKLSPPPSGKTYVLSASLVQLSSERDGEAERAACRVSMTLRTRSEGALSAILNGRASVSDDPSHADRARRTAMQAAVDSALGRVGEALR